MSSSHYCKAKKQQDKQRSLPRVAAHSFCRVQDGAHQLALVRLEACSKHVANAAIALLCLKPKTRKRIKKKSETKKEYQ